MKQCFILTALVSALIFFGCAKDGTPGLDGENGEQGIPGVDGTALLNGNGAPNSSLGKNGDFYLDKTTVSIYGPKTAAGWGEPTPLKGKDGEDGKDGKDGTNGTNGKDGSKILSGSQIPTMQDGAIGDFYFDTQNIAIYGPKTSTSWGLPVSLKTPTGKEVTVLLYKNHSFQTLTYRGSSDHNGQGDILGVIESLETDKAQHEAVIAQERQILEENISYINSITDITEEERDNRVTEALQAFSERTYYLQVQLSEIYMELNNVLNDFVYEMESVIPIDSRYQDVYENGVILAYMRKSNDLDLTWWDYGFANLTWWSIYGGMVVKEMKARPADLLLQDRIIVKGDAYGYTENEIKANKIDIKIVFIPATNVIEMQAKGVNTGDFKAVAKHMGL